jgi:hypothetical protein
VKESDNSPFKMTASNDDSELSKKKKKKVD